MRHYLGSVQNYFRTIDSTVRSLFHPLRSTSLRSMRVLALILIPSGLVSWGFYAFAMPSSNSLNKDIQSKVTHSQPPVESPVQSQTSLQPTTTPSSDIKGSATNTNQTQVRVNGQDVSVPANGQVHKDIATENGTTAVDITSDSSSSGSSQSTFNMQLDVRSQTETRSGP